MPQDPLSPFWPRIRRGVQLSLAVGVGAALVICIHDWLQVSDQRNATLQLMPDAALPDVSPAEWCLRGVGAGIGLAAAGILAVAFRVSTSTRATLLRFPPFWIGLAFLGYIGVQSLNPWALVVERDLTWNTIFLDHVKWLPAGLAAPFVADEDPGMNGWRQLLIFSGPWMLLCALRAGVPRRRTLVALGWVAGINALAVAIVGNMVYAANSPEFLGYRPPHLTYHLFGPFVNRNHAGVYFYLTAALVLALTCQLILRKGDRADKGGPHLIGAILFFMLCLGSASTVGIGALLAAITIYLFGALLYFLDRRLRAAISPLPALALFLLSLGLGFVAVGTANLGLYRYRLAQKLELMERTGLDDRAPLRAAARLQLADGGAARLAFGWGAGSYRWTSPPYLARQPELLNSKGRLWRRVSYAHCDWLQALIEWGVVGCGILLVGLGWLVGRIWCAWRARSSPALALSVALVLVLSHASIDFIFYFTPVLTLLALIIAWLALADDAESARSGY